MNSFQRQNQGNTGTSWGKLTSINQNLDNVNLINKAYKIGRNSSNDVPIPDAKISSNHCIITLNDDRTVTLQDLSSNGTFIGDQKIGKGKSKLLNDGSKIYLLPSSKIAEKDLFGYIFTLNNPEPNPLKRGREQQEEFSQRNKQIKPQETQLKQQQQQNDQKNNKALSSDIRPTNPLRPGISENISGREQELKRQRYFQLMTKFTAE
jgi:hypothetical protein